MAHKDSEKPLGSEVVNTFTCPLAAIAWFLLCVVEPTMYKAGKYSDYTTAHRGQMGSTALRMV